MIAIGLVIVLAAGVMLWLFMNVMAQGAHKPLKASDLNPELVAQRWAEINAQMQSPSGLKNALVEADKLLDYVMRGRGYRGETMADRLKNAQNSLHNREAVWQAHKLRNTVVHEVGFDLVPQQVQQAVQALGQAIRDLGVPLR